jgi:hypothetical protein
MFWPAQIDETQPTLRRHSRTPALALEIRQVRAWLAWLTRLGRVALLQNLPRATCLEATNSQRNEPCPVCKYGHLSIAHWLVSSTHPSAILASAMLMQFTILA